MFASEEILKYKYKAYPINYSYKVQVPQNKTYFLLIYGVI